MNKEIKEKESQEEAQLRQYLHNTIDVMSFLQLKTLAKNLGLRK